MSDAHRVTGIDAEDHLPEDVARLRLLEPAVRHDEVEELATTDVLCDEVDVLGLLDHLQ